MLFNSIEFTIFLPVVFLLYWLVFRNRLKLQNTLLLAASYFFYGWWDWRFLSLIVFSSFVDYAVGIGLSRYEKKNQRKLLLLTSVIVNLGFLGFFKYFNFFAESFSDAFTLLGKPIETARLNIVLPIGISFYTFQTLSYSIDIYRKKLEPTRDLLAFFAFVSFFPQLVAGPIERATNLLPQFFIKRKLDKTQAIDGLKQILWGFFKKIVIADNCANFVNEIFADYSSFSGSTLLLGAFFFTIQIYADFSGYSDIAIGTARLFGFKLMQNFAFPYFSRDIAEYWRRWHISLSTWFRDYLYYPLGGSRVGNWKKVRNVFAIFLLSGLWHGANWTFVVWGALNAIYFLPLILMKRNRKHLDTVAEGKFFPTFREVLLVGITFLQLVLVKVFFRSRTVMDAIHYIGGIFSKSLFSIPQKHSLDLLIIVSLFMLVEWMNRQKPYALYYESVSDTKKWPPLLRSVGYCVIIWAIILWGAFDNQEFIYFQF